MDIEFQNGSNIKITGDGQAIRGKSAPFTQWSKLTKIEQLKPLVEIQGTDGNWNYDPYMHGMFNGMELALSILEEREPAYKDAPEKWLSEDSK